MGRPITGRPKCWYQSWTLLLVSYYGRGFAGDKKNIDEYSNAESLIVIQLKNYVVLRKYGCELEVVCGRRGVAAGIGREK